MGITFDDFPGQEYIKRELQEIVRILKNEEEFHGPRGTFKTLLVKAIAGVAGLPFFASNGSDFVEMFAGIAASRVKDLFASARSFAPSIIFVDEIDAFGSKHGEPDFGGGGAEREQGLLQILTEMDGFKESTSQVLVIGATNRLYILDPAMLRKGRFDKIIRVGLPSKNAYCTSVDEYGALLYAGRWGLHGISLPGRVTFAPENMGFSTFGAPRPFEVMKIKHTLTWS